MRSEELDREAMEEDPRLTRDIEDAEDRREEEHYANHCRVCGELFEVSGPHICKEG